MSNTVLVGLVVNGALAVLPETGSVALQIGLLVSGIALNALATACYIGAGLGPAPRDGLMTGIAARGHSIRVVRTLIEHFVSATDHPCGAHPTYDLLTMLTWIAAHTSRISVATRVLAVPFRRPAMVAKLAESLDRLSGGRLILGLGPGYMDEEIQAVGGPVPSAGAKIDGLADALQIHPRRLEPLRLQLPREAAQRA